MTDYKPKLIEVALPLVAINLAAAKEKTMGAAPHPQNLHRWWARRPLAAARAVLWSSLVDDPSGDDTMTEDEQNKERQRLFGILERFVRWENSNNLDVLAEARAEVRRCYPDGAPAILDPFGGGGAIPLEAQRLGLRALSGDLNPVAVLIQKAMVEVPPRFSGRRPVHPGLDSELATWERVQGLAGDVEAYGTWMREEAERRVGEHFPSAKTPAGSAATPIAWIWARTVVSPDPTWAAPVPLVASWSLSKKKGKQVWIEPDIDRTKKAITYRVRTGGSPAHQGTMSRGNGVCIATGSAIPAKYIREQAQLGNLGRHLIAVVADEPGTGRTYCSPTVADVEAAEGGTVDWRPEQIVPTKNHDVDRLPMYGMLTWGDAFTHRQLVALNAFSALLDEVEQKVAGAALKAGFAADDTPLRDGGSGAKAYAEAIRTYLAFNVDKCAEHWCSICSWHANNEQIRNAFSRQAIPMVWDYSEANPFSRKMASWDSQLKGLVGAIRDCLSPSDAIAGEVEQRDAEARVAECKEVLVSTDPPYYDNISYADVSDFFYVWLRRNLAAVWPDECATLVTPKSQELIANPYRAGSKSAAEEHFETGMASFMGQLSRQQIPDAPTTIYYAYKATETVSGGVRSTGWDTFLQGVIDANLQVTATWPMRTELGNRLLASKGNALASSIVLACRSRNSSAPLASRGEFIAALRAELPQAVRILQSGNIAPVDLAQSTIGPGIKVFSRYAKVVEADGSSMSVSDALAIINDVLGEVLDGEEAELDRDTRFAVTWYTQNGYKPGRSGDADAQARAKNTSLNGIEDSGIGEARDGQFRLFERSELNPGWDPVDDDRRTVWEATQYLVAALERSETEAAELLHRMGGYADRARQLAYVLFQKATDKGWAEEAGAYNGLITAWPSLQGMGGSGEAQGSLL